MRDFYAVAKFSVALCKQQLIDRLTHAHTHTRTCHKYHWKPYKYLQFANFVGQRGVCAIYANCNRMQVSEAAAGQFKHKFNFKAEEKNKERKGEIERERKTERVGRRRK